MDPRAPGIGFANAVWTRDDDSTPQMYPGSGAPNPILAATYEHHQANAGNFATVPGGPGPSNYFPDHGDQYEFSEEASAAGHWSSMEIDSDPMSEASNSSSLQGNRSDPVKLSGPIAFAKDSDVEKIPISKDGRAQCAHCGAIGVKHSFYTKERKYCSRNCAKEAGVKGVSLNVGSNPISHRSSGNEVPVKKKTVKLKVDPSVVAIQAAQQATSRYTNTNPKLPRIEFVPPKITLLDESRDYPDDEYKTGPFNFDTEGSYDWADCIADLDFKAAPVSCFKHAPLSSTWDKISVGMKVEVPCRCDTPDGPDYDVENDKYWIATVVRIQGYMGMLRFMGMPNPEPVDLQTLGDFWIHLCSDEMKPVGWCASQGKLLIPPPWMVNQFPDWREYLVKNLTGARTLLKNFGDERREKCDSPFLRGQRVEVIDREKISQVRVATIHDIFGGRLHLRYQGLSDEDPGTWAHESSPSLKPVGWALDHLHDMEVSREYLDRVRRRLGDDRDAPMSNFEQDPSLDPANLAPENSRDFMPGDKLECVDPLNANVIGSATVERVLPGRYLMIQMDWYLPEERARDAFCRHASSKYIFPCGFCKLSNIPLKPPVGWDEDTFTWEEYFQETSSQAAPIELFYRTVPHHGFEVGMKVECVDATDPRLICAATIVQIVRRLLRIHFDGWDEEYDMWIDCESPDIFPIGFCVLINYPLQSPREEAEQKRRRTGGRRGRKRKSNTGNRQGNKNSVSPQMPPLTPSLTGQPATPPLYEESVAVQPTVTATNGVGKKLKESDVEEVKVSEESGKKASEEETGGELNMAAVGEWTIGQVGRFLRDNGSGQFGDRFREKGIDGKKFLTLTISDVMELTGNKMGPAAKIHKLIDDLNLKLNPSLLRSRQSNLNRNRL